MDKTVNLPHEHHAADAQTHIMEAMPDDEMIRAVSDALGQLGDPSRLRIFWLLCHTEECVADIAAYSPQTGLRRSPSRLLSPGNSPAALSRIPSVSAPV